MHSSEFDDKPRLPCVNGLLAGTLALMTTWAMPENDASVELRHRRLLIARKIVANLALLRQHADVSPALRLVMGKVGERWASLALEHGHGAAPFEAGPATPGAAEPVRLH